MATGRRVRTKDTDAPFTYGTINNTAGTSYCSLIIYLKFKFLNLYILSPLKVFFFFKRVWRYI